MLIKPLALDPAHTFANDLLARASFISKLKNILVGGEREIVLGLNGAWGTGKTTCVNFLKNELINDGHVVILLNAWADDHISDPLVSIIASLVQDERFKRLVKDEELIGRLTLAGKKILDLGANLVISRLSGGTLTIHDIGNVAENEPEYKDVLKSYAEEKKQITLLKNIFGEISKSLQEDNKKIIFIVDELDRCNPIYAVSLFERIKHVLEVENLRVLLSFDQQQLEATIQNHYGSKIDATRYLEKMFDLILNLPPVKLDKLLNETVKQLELPATPNLPMRPGSIDDLLGMLLSLLNATQGSARELERILTRVKFLWSRDTQLGVDPAFAVILLILRSQNSEIFEKIKTGVSNFSEVNAFFIQFVNGARYWTGSFSNYVETLYYIKQDYKSDQVDLTQIEISSQAFNELTDDKKLKRQRMQSYISTIQDERFGELSEMAHLIEFVIQ